MTNQEPKNKASQPTTHIAPTQYFFEARCGKKDGEEVRVPVAAYTPSELLPQGITPEMIHEYVMTGRSHELNNKQA